MIKNRYELQVEKKIDLKLDKNWLKIDIGLSSQKERKFETLFF